MVFVTSPTGTAFETAILALPAHIAKVKDAARQIGRDVRVLINPLVVCRPTDAEAEAYANAIVAASEPTGFASGNSIATPMPGVAARYMTARASAGSAVAICRSWARRNVWQRVSCGCMRPASTACNSASTISSRTWPISVEAVLPLLVEAGAAPMSTHLLSLIVAGGLDTLTYWSLAFLIASGLTVVFGMLGFLNVAHTSFYMLAGYIAFSVAGRTGSFWLALLLAPPVTVGLGLAAERLLFRRLYAAGHTPQLLLTIGIAYVIAEATKMVWGDDALTVAPPPGLRGHLVILGATLPVYHLFVIAITMVLVALLALLIGGLGSAWWCARPPPIRKWSMPSVSN